MDFAYANDLDATRFRGQATPGYDICFRIINTRCAPWRKSACRRNTWCPLCYTNGLILVTGLRVPVNPPPGLHRGLIMGPPRPSSRLKTPSNT
ncbi:MAG: hypothetical protein ACLT8E_07430 [Akkermansia sp.]